MNSRKELVEHLMHESGGVCVYCGKKVTEATMEVDHIFPKSKGGQNIFENYACSCHVCNASKADNLPQEFFASLSLKKQRAMLNRLGTLQKGKRISREKMDLLVMGTKPVVAETVPNDLPDCINDNCLRLDLGRLAGHRIILTLQLSME